MNAVRDEVVTSEKKARSGGLKDKLEALIPNFDMSKLRKPLVMGAAALLLAIVAFKGYTIITGGKNTQVAKMKDVQVSEAATAKSQVREIGNATNETSPQASQVSEAYEKILNNVENATEDSGNPTNQSNGAPDTANGTNYNELMKNLTAESDLASDGFTAKASPETNASELAIPSPVKNPISKVLEKANVAVEAPPVVQEKAKSETPSAVYDVPTGSGPAALVAAASSGDAKALFQLGMRYSEGDTVTRNMSESAKWFQRSADVGFAPAQYSIGSLYEKGIGVERDITMASKWYEKAAAQGNARAMHNLAVIQAMGNPPEIQPNIERAVEWFQKAANFGIKDSQFNLGILYGQGMGVPQNLGESYKWFALAAKTGDNDAGKKRDEVANAMDPDDLDEARKEVNNWAPRKLNVEANRVAVPEEWRGRGGSSKQSAAVSTNSPIKQAQALLNQRGFSVGEPDGLMGPKTKKAIIEFQRGAGIPVTGAVDTRLLKALDIQT